MSNNTPLTPQAVLERRKLFLQRFAPSNKIEPTSVSPTRPIGISGSSGNSSSPGTSPTKIVNQAISQLAAYDQDSEEEEDDEEIIDYQEVDDEDLMVQQYPDVALARTRRGAEEGEFEDEEMIEEETIDEEEELGMEEEQDLEGIDLEDEESMDSVRRYEEDRSTLLKRALIDQVKQLPPSTTTTMPSQSFSSSSSQSQVGPQPKRKKYFISDLPPSTTTSAATMMSGSGSQSSNIKLQISSSSSSKSASSSASQNQALRGSHLTKKYPQLQFDPVDEEDNDDQDIYPMAIIESDNSNTGLMETEGDDDEESVDQEEEEEEEEEDSDLSNVQMVSISKAVSKGRGRPKGSPIQLVKGGGGVGGGQSSGNSVNLSRSVIIPFRSGGGRPSVQQSGMNTPEMTITRIPKQLLQKTPPRSATPIRSRRELMEEMKQEFNEQEEGGGGGDDSNITGFSTPLESTEDESSRPGDDGENSSSPSKRAKSNSAAAVVAPDESESGDGSNSRRRTSRLRQPPKIYVADLGRSSRKEKQKQEKELAKEMSVKRQLEFSFKNLGENIMTDRASEAVVNSSTRTPQTPQSSRTPHGTGRGRGRPRGSTLKNRGTRDAAGMTSSTIDNIVDDILKSQTPTTTTTTTSSTDLDLDSSAGVPKAKSSKTSSGKDKDSADEQSLSPSKPLKGPGSRGIRGPYKPRKNKDKELNVNENETEVKVVKEKKKERKKSSSPSKKQALQVFDEETLMNADSIQEGGDKAEETQQSSQTSQTTTNNSNSGIESASATNTNNAPNIELDAQVSSSNLSSTNTSVVGTTTTKTKKNINKDLVLEDRKPVTAETLFEYRWPPTGSNSDHYMLQEQVAEYLGVKSFKRKYPTLKRRVVEMAERDFLRKEKVVTETQCDLGLTALYSNEVMEIMRSDFQQKYEALCEALSAKLEAKKQRAAQLHAESVKNRSADFMRKLLKSAADYNSFLNKDRRTFRPYSMDLQTYTVHQSANLSKKQTLPPEATKIGYFPIASLPGQYVDQVRKFEADDLKYLPLSTVIYGPVKDPKLDISDSEDSESDSDDSSSGSDDSSSSSEDSHTGSKGGSDSVPNKNSTTSTFGFTPILGEEGGATDENSVCKTCEGNVGKNKDGIPEVLISCTKCDVANHPSCLELSLDMLPYIKKYNWQCTDCKNCIECNDPADEDKMLFCDLCDRGYHIYCVGLRKVPTGRWHCNICAVCNTCGTKKPSAEDRSAEWHHEFKKGEKKDGKFFLHSHCVSCHKLYKRGQYCPVCLKCHIEYDKEILVECRTCELWLHRDCVKNWSGTKYVFRCDTCTEALKTKLPSFRV